MTSDMAEEIKAYARAAVEAGLPIRAAVTWFEGVVVLQHLISNEGNTTRAAKTLGIGRRHTIRMGGRAGVLPWRGVRREENEDD